MDRSRFTSEAFGRVIVPAGPWPFPSYVPAALPRRLQLTAETVLALSDADTALGRLAGAGRLLPDPHLLARPYVTREALASSRIEGTQASLSDVYQAAAEGGSREDSDVREVENYIAAMDEGLRLLATLPISGRLLQAIHAVLMRGVRGRENTPGEFRRSPNWICAADDRPENAIFVPPPVEEMHRSLADWERFANGDHSLPPLIACALLHYQFETIHPFLDGNGRLGRLLIVFYLMEQQRLTQPLLYVSPYFEARRPDYYDRLQAIRERGEVQEWLQFFLRAVTTQATDAIDRAEVLVDLRERYRQSLAGSRTRVAEVVDLMLLTPVVTTRLVADRLAVTPQAALNYINELAERGWLQQLPTRGRGGRIYWLAAEVFAVLEAPAAGT
ncbi:MAG: Fic family protein [Actinomycetota bacterium]|jgi:Fic family protein|nr:Fic family protein [Euzebyaceae bacterium]MDQ3430953.1 Fic family protein [Actinomycetota bacterium]